MRAGTEDTTESARYCPTCERSFAGHSTCPDDGTRLVVIAVSLDPLLGRELDGRFSVDARIGAGAMGAVYRGRQRSVGRDVAIKTIHPQLVAAPEVIKRFLREAKLASRLSHPHAVSVLDFGQTEDGTFYLVMELLRGRTLDEVIASEGPLAPARVIRIGDQIADALGAAHAQQVLHRDLKPANVMRLDGDDVHDLIKVMDFGLAKSLSADTTSATVTGSGAVLGTPAFMSPEAALGQPGDARSDLYSLGAVLYALASGRAPFAAASVPDMLIQQATATPPPLVGVPAPLAAVIMRLLAKEPADRYASAAAVRVALADAATRVGGLTMQGRTVRPRRPAWVIGAGLAVLGGGAALVLLTRAEPTPPRAPAAAPPVAAPTIDAAPADAPRRAEAPPADAAGATRPPSQGRPSPRPDARPARPDAQARPRPPEPTPATPPDAGKAPPW